MDKRLVQFQQELKGELKGNILSWWSRYMPDKHNGGFHGHVDHNNQVVDGAGKGSVLNARILWTYSSAYLHLKDSACLGMARQSYEYILDYFMDHDKGGVYWELNADGSVGSDRKQIYALAFTIYGLSEYHRACGDERALQHAKQLYKDIEKQALDRERNGYIEALDRDWKPVDDLRLSEKDENESKTMNTHLHVLEAYGNLYRIWKDPELAKALENLIMLFLDYFVNDKSKRLILFFDDDWTQRSNMISYGHDIECSWLLHEAAEILGKEELIARTSALAVEMATANLDGVDRDGGLMYEYFPSTKELDGDKHWWPQAEAMVGYFNAWEVSGEESFLEQSLRSWEFVKQKLVDRDKGEWIWSVSREGEPQTEKEKGGFWKCPYHNGRACLELMQRIEKLKKQAYVK